jgi:hypothetical protein
MENEAQQQQAEFKADPKPEVKHDPAFAKPEKPKTETKEDHLGIIAELASSLGNVSPSGAESVRDKILERVAAIQDPKAYDERMAAEKKAEDELEAARAKDRAANKMPVPEKAKA